MPDDREGLGEVVRDVAKAFDVSYGELQLGNPILNPIKAHVAGLGELLLDGPIGETYGDLIVAMYRRWGLGVSKVG